MYTVGALYLIEILHQTTTTRLSSVRHRGCILSKFYIKPQQRVRHKIGHSVVSYRNSTSNHNSACAIKSATPVVSYRNSTSNHNTRCYGKRPPKVVSYRNSTSNHNKSGTFSMSFMLYLIEILHQTTTATDANFFRLLLYLIEILHQTTTREFTEKIGKLLYLIEILHQTTTSGLILIDKVLLTGCLPL